jgi:PAS domain S-box-containing protein
MEGTMTGFFRGLFSTDFMPHGMCYLWDPAIVWLNVVSEGIIAAAYYAIPFLIFYFIRRRRDISFKPILAAFGVFILACGTTHLLGAVTVWNPVYRLDGVIRAITAIASVATFAMMVPMMPVLVALPSPSDLVTEQLKAERVLRESEAQFHTLADVIPQLSWMSNPDGRIFWYNQRWYEYTGTTPEEMQGWSWQKVLHPDHVARVVERTRHCMETGEPGEDTFLLRGKDGQYRWFLSRAVPIRDSEGRIVRWFGTSTDITEQRRAEEEVRKLNEELEDRVAQRTEERRKLEDQLIQSQKMEAVGKLAGGVAHDFNNLLTVILGFSEMVREHVKEDQQALEAVGEVFQAAQRAAALTSQLLAFSRRQVATPRVTSLNEVVQNTDKMLRRVIGEDIQLSTRLSPELAPARIDPVHIEQVILNLAVNSRDAMPQGGKLAIETANVDLGGEYAGEHLGVEPGPYVMLAVSDTGIGMDAKTMSQIFEPFFTTKELGKGTGLGLSTVFGIVKQNGGEVQVYSEPGHGTVFKIYFPAVAEHAEALPAERPQVELVSATETVLLVEDEDQVRHLTRRLLTSQGYRVLEASSGRSALVLAREHPERIDLLLTDVVMPQMSGPDLAKEVRSAHPETRILFMSGYTDTAIALQGSFPIGTPFVQKPFTSANLQKKVREALRS